MGRFPEKKDAKEATVDWSKRHVKKLSFWIGLICYSALVGLVVTGLLIGIRRWIPLPPALFGGIVGGVTGGTGFIAMRWYWRDHYRRFLRTRLNTLGIPICMKCAYDLTANESGACPECGTRL